MSSEYGNTHRFYVYCLNQNRAGRITKMLAAHWQKIGNGNCGKENTPVPHSLLFRTKKR